LSGIEAQRLFRRKMVFVSTKDDTVSLLFSSSPARVHNMPDSTIARQPMP